MNKKGFTLIELLLVIAILGALSAAVVIAINPTKRLGQAGDTKVKNDFSQIATALSAYYTENGFYPTETAGLAALTTSQDLKSVPVASTGYTYTYKATASCTNTGTALCTDSSLEGNLKQPKLANAVWCWMSSSGVAGEVLTAACLP